MCKVSIRISLLFYFHTRFIMYLECMFKGVWWWDLTKIIKLVANLHAKNPRLISSDYFPSIEWFLLKIRDWQGCWPKSSPCPSKMCFNHEALFHIGVVSKLWFVGQSQDHFLSIDIDYEASMSMGPRLTGITRFVVPKPRPSWFRGKRLGYILDI